MIVLAAGVAAVLFDENVSGVVVLIAIAALVLGVLAAGALYVNREISHLHREWLASVVLIRRLEPFRDDLREYLAANAEPDHKPLATADETRDALEKALSEWPPKGTTPQAKTGELLFAVLGPVSTVHYESDLDIRDLTMKVLAKVEGQ